MTESNITTLLSDTSLPVYFLGIGGIGMSALARYLAFKGHPIAGYDRVASPLCRDLESEGIVIHYADDVSLIPPSFRSADTLVIYTPAIPSSLSELEYFRSRGFRIMKRAALLGEITRLHRSLCVAGTHGKTTTSALTAHILHETAQGINAFLGGISCNYETNFLYSSHSDYVVVEADEFDRSFHHLSPFAAVVTSTDADHLDIYGSHERYVDAFNTFTSLISPEGVLIHKLGIKLSPRLSPLARNYSYALSDSAADFHAFDIRINEGAILFSIHTPQGNILDINLGVPVFVNIENAVAAAALALVAGATFDEIRHGISSFRGTLRRFNILLRTPHILIDDYAHHPAEISACLSSIKRLYPTRRILTIFQPHLYSRTRDFFPSFATSLSLSDGVVLLPIYPAREEPIEGVSSSLIARSLPPTVPCYETSKSDLFQTISPLRSQYDIFITLGAGDIDQLVSPLREFLSV